MVMIPNLPDDIAAQCLIRLPKFAQLRLRSVSKYWNEQLISEEFRALRTNHKLVEEWLLVIVSRSSLVAYDFKSSYSCRIRVSDEAEKQLSFMGVGCASSGNLFFLLGGSSTSAGGFQVQHHSDVTIFNAATSSWSVGESMKRGRSYFACGSIDGTLYVAGGENRQTSVEAYDVQSGKWSQAAAMPFGFDQIESFAVLKRKLYVTGLVAFDDGRKVLVFDPSVGAGESAWKCCEGLEKGLRKGELVATKEYLYLISRSGWSGYVGRYEEDADEWIQVGSFMPFLSSNRSQDVFMIEGSSADDLVDLKSSRKLREALLRAAWQCPGAIVSV